MDSTMTPLVASGAARLFEEKGKHGLKNYFEALGGESRFHAYFFDIDGKEELGQTAPNGVKAMLQAAKNTDETQVEEQALGRLIGQRTSGPDGTQYVMVLVMATPSMMPFLRASPGIQFLRFFAVLIAAGLVCFWLARHITAPVRKLQMATRQLAEGNLGARVGSDNMKGQDEIAELSLEFDNMAEQVQALMASQRRLMGDISHELRSPLARLSVALGLARRNANPEIAGALDRIERETERLNELIGNLLRLARLESGAEPMHRETIELDGLLREVVEDADFEAQSRNRSVRLVVAERCAISGSRELVRSAIENVVRNAMNYTAEGTGVEVSLNCVRDSAAGCALIRVRDHGKGVPEDALADIFRPFYRVAESRDRSSGGTGLGLTIVERAAQVHGGQVKAENSDGGGLVVEIRLPVAEGDRARAEASSAEQRVASIS
jgi:two-component system sensor histidine kinase CpxA